MFQRDAYNSLENWKNSDGRKPLLLRGARQVGKTTVVQDWSKTFKQYIYLNLEILEDVSPFENFTNMENLLKEIFFLKKQQIQLKSETLLFIDEIQESERAIGLLRYFYEQYPEIPVIAAGSLLESLFDTNTSFPVGRVEYMAVKPCSFKEFLGAIGEERLKEFLKIGPSPNYVHEELVKHFRTFAIIGGMPEIVKKYAEKRDFTVLKPRFDSLIQGYLDDVEKYASSETQARVIRYCIENVLLNAGKRITFEGFGKGKYRSREIGEALRVLEKAMLIQLVYPQLKNTLPFEQDSRKSPRLQFLDTGILSYYNGLQLKLLGTNQLDSVYEGLIVEHLVGQEILTTSKSILHKLHFWVREKSDTSAEVDYIFERNGTLWPIEVKSGAVGKLRSLFQYMKTAENRKAIRFYNGPYERQTVEMFGVDPFELINLPWYLAGSLGNDYWEFD
jgi:predicted AAA+ superfamily ATPase